jgi:hypothetical protein
MVSESEMEALAAGIVTGIYVDAMRWRKARRLADDISDPTLRGIVTTFLDRFGTASETVSEVQK